MLRFLNGDCSKGDGLISGIHLSVLFIKRRKCKLGSKCASKHTEKAWGKPKKRHDAQKFVRMLPRSSGSQYDFSLKFYNKVPWR